jgi:hypothetical protein
MISHSKRVIRYIPKENVKYLPEGKSMFLTHFTKRSGMAKVELDFDWMKNNTGLYERLIGRR